MTSEHAFGRYTLCERIGLGGMAEIFRARTTGPGGFEMEVCIKRILPHCSEDQDFVAMFIDEARVAARLRHANIVQILDFNVVDDRYYIAMELVEGKDLRSVLHALRGQGATLGPARAALIAAEMCRGLGHAHTRHERGMPMNIVHRDVSPHNVLLSFAGEVKISDFGIAKATSRMVHTATGTVKGKLAYMSPEQAAGEAELDHRSDQFATGLVLFEMLSGRRAYEGESQATILRSALRGAVPDVRELVPEVPASLAEIVVRSTRVDRDQRYCSMAEMEAALRRWIFERQPGPEDLDPGPVVLRLFGDGRGDRPRTEVLPAVADLPPFEDAPDAEHDSVWAESPVAAGQITSSRIDAPADVPLTTMTSTVVPQDEALFERALTPVASPSIETAAARSLARAQHEATVGLQRRWVVALSASLVIVATALVYGLVPRASQTAEGPVASAGSAGSGFEQPVDPPTGSGAVDPGSNLIPGQRRDASATPPVLDAGVEVREADAAVSDAGQGVVPSPTVAPRAPRGKGKVLVYLSDGWAEVWVGQRKMGITPTEFELPAGRRTLRLFNPELKREMRVTVKIEPNQTARVAHSLHELR